jgi:hypothetical protein
MMSILHISPPVISSALVVLPKVIQSVFAAASDFYTWKLAEKVFGTNSNQAWAAVSIPRTPLQPVLTRTTVLGVCLQPLALVLLHQNVLQLGGDDLDHCSPILLAVGDTSGCHKETAGSTGDEEQRKQLALVSGLGGNSSAASAN